MSDANRDPQIPGLLARFEEQRADIIFREIKELDSAETVAGDHLFLVENPRELTKTITYAKLIAKIILDVYNTVGALDAILDTGTTLTEEDYKILARVGSGKIQEWSYDNLLHVISKDLFWKPAAYWDTANVRDSHYLMLMHENEPATRILVSQFAKQIVSTIDRDILNKIIDLPDRPDITGSEKFHIATPTQSYTISMVNLQRKIAHNLIGLLKGLKTSAALDTRHLLMVGDVKDNAGQVLVEGGTTTLVDLARFMTKTIFSSTAHPLNGVIQDNDSVIFWRPSAGALMSVTRSDWVKSVIDSLFTSPYPRRSFGSWELPHNIGHLDSIVLRSPAGHIYYANLLNVMLLMFYTLLEKSPMRPDTFIHEELADLKTVVKSKDSIAAGHTESIDLLNVAKKFEGYYLDKIEEWRELPQVSLQHKPDDPKVLTYEPGVPGRTGFANIYQTPISQLIPPPPPPPDYLAGIPRGFSPNMHIYELTGATGITTAGIHEMAYRPICYKVTGPREHTLRITYRRVDIDQYFYLNWHMTIKLAARAGAPWAGLTLMLSPIAAEADPGEAEVVYAKFTTVQSIPLNHYQSLCGGWYQLRAIDLDYEPERPNVHRAYTLLKV